MSDETVVPVSKPNLPLWAVLRLEHGYAGEEEKRQLVQGGNAASAADADHERTPILSACSQNCRAVRR